MSDLKVVFAYSLRWRGVEEQEVRRQRSLMKEPKNRSGSFICEGNDWILLSESNLSSGFPVGYVVRERQNAVNDSFKNSTSVVNKKRVLALHINFPQF